MASVLKRKRGAVAAAESLKRAKSVEEKPVTATLFDDSKTGWDAAFGDVKKSAGELVKANGDDTVNGAGDAESDGEDFQTFVQKISSKNQKSERSKGEETWRRSNPIAGRMLDIDPIFTNDEQFLIVAHRRSLKVYSTSNSLLNRSIDLPVEQTSAAGITSFVLSLNDSNKIWVACSDGQIFNIDWTTGEGVNASWATSNTNVTQIAVGSIGTVENERDVIFTAGLVDETWKILAHDLSVVEGTPTIQTKVVHTSTEAYHIMRAIGKKPVIIAAAEKNVLVGALTSKTTDAKAVSQMRYEFMSFESPEVVSSLDARVSTRTSDKDILFGRSKASKPESKIVDLIVGNVKGSIFVHNDLLGKLHRSQAKLPNGKPLPQSATSLVPRKLHWHRKSVASAKWSLDGNYIISGGSETTLVLWQLDTGHQQFLPHLSATIVNIVVSPTGTSYAVHLADNSTMVLSTAELVPTANISGLQAHVIQSLPQVRASVPRVTESVRDRPLVPRTPAVTNPANPSQLILAVGESQSINPRSTELFSTQYLQTFDVASNQNVSRQALTRTNVTNNNITPYALPISEPVISHMQISHDGSWLATVDEWVPSKRDIESLGHGESSIEVEQERRREVYLKFWQRQKADETWALVNRIDSPHNSESDGYGTGRVLGLASDPNSLSFATIGEDGAVMVWRPRVRTRDGIAVRGDNGESISTWTCQRRVPLGRSGLRDDNTISGALPEHAALAFSEDGSVLAAALDGSDDHLIHLIDPFTGLVRVSRPIMYKGDLISLAFVGQYLIILSDDLRVYDLVVDELRYGVELEDIKSLLSLEQKAEMMHLTVDRKSRTFAVTLPCGDEWDLKVGESVGSLSHAFSEVSVFTPESAVPVFTQTCPALATAVLPAISSPGFIVVDAAAEITTLAPKAVQTLVSMSRPMVELRLDLVNEEAPSKSLSGLLDDDEEVDEPEEAEDMDIDAESIGDDGPPVVSQHQLARIFDVGPAFAMPPIEDLFYQVADLFSNKPTVQQT